jgi:hypothetical protein
MISFDAATALALSFVETVTGRHAFFATQRQKHAAKRYRLAPDLAVESVAHDAESRENTPNSSPEKAANWR